MEMTDTEIVLMVKNMAAEMVSEMIVVRNADEPKFDNERFLLDKKGGRLFTNETTASLVIRKYKEAGIDLEAVKHRGDVYFKRM